MQKIVDGQMHNIILLKTVLALIAHTMQAGWAQCLQCQANPLLRTDVPNELILRTCCPPPPSYLRMTTCNIFEGG